MTNTKRLMAVVAIAFGLQTVSVAAATTAPTAKQCANVQTFITDANKFIAYLQSLKQTKIVVAAIKEAQEEVAKAQSYYNANCSSGNNFSTDTNIECSVVNSSLALIEVLQLTTSGGLTNDPTLGTKVICMTSNACTNIVSQKFIFSGQLASARCANPSDLTVYHLSDADMQSKINALP